MSQNKHWTTRDADSFRFSVVADFVDQIEERLIHHKISKKKLSELLGVTPGRVSQLLSDPGNLTIQSMVDLVRALQLKMTILTYDEGDSEPGSGPITSDVFLACWNRLGKPTTAWDIDEPISGPGEYQVHHVKWDNVIPFPKRTVCVARSDGSLKAAAAGGEKSPELATAQLLALGS